MKRTPLAMKMFAVIVVDKAAVAAVVAGVAGGGFGSDIVVVVVDVAVVVVVVDAVAVVHADVVVGHGSRPYDVLRVPSCGCCCCCCDCCCHPHRWRAQKYPQRQPTVSASARLSSWHDPCCRER